MSSKRFVAGGLRSAIFFMLVACFSGCTAAQRQYQAISQNTQSVVTQARACLTPIYNSPAAAPVRVHTPFNANDITLAELSDTSVATKSEINSILIIHPFIKECQKGTLEGLIRTTPSLVPIIAEQYDKGEDALLLLIERKIPWGDYNKLRRDDFVAGQIAVQKESQRIMAGLEQENEAEIARRQAAFSALAQWVQTQQMINAVNRPVITNCNRFGSMVNCVSQ